MFLFDQIFLLENQFKFLFENFCGCPVLPRCLLLTSFYTSINFNYILFGYRINLQALISLSSNFSDIFCSVVYQTDDAADLNFETLLYLYF